MYSQNTHKDKIDSSNWLPFKIGDYSITDPNRLLQHFAEEIYLGSYITSSNNYLGRVNNFYQGLKPTDFVRNLFASRLLP